MTWDHPCVGEATPQSQGVPPGIYQDMPLPCVMTRDELSAIHEESMLAMLDVSPAGTAPCVEDRDVALNVAAEVAWVGHTNDAVRRLVEPALGALERRGPFTQAGPSSEST